MDYENVKGIVEAVQRVYQVCTYIFDRLRNPRADAGYTDARHANEEYLRKNHLVDAANLHSKFSTFISDIGSVHHKFDSNLDTQTATTVLENIPTCYGSILRKWKNDGPGLRDLGDSNVEQLNQAVAQVEESIVTVILGAMTEVSESLRKETGGNQYFQLCKSKFDAAASQFDSHAYSHEALTYKPRVLQYNPDMIKFLCDVQGAIVTWRAYGQDRTSPEPTKKIKIMQSIVRICIFSQPEIFNNEEDLDEDIRNRLNEAPSVVTLDTHVRPITLKLAQLHQMAARFHV